MEVVVYDVSQCIHPEAICCQIGRGGDCIDAIINHINYAQPVTAVDRTDKEE